MSLTVNGIILGYQDIAGDGGIKGILFPFEDDRGVRQDATRVNSFIRPPDEKKPEDIINEWLSINPEITVNYGRQ